MNFWNLKFHFAISKWTFEIWQFTLKFQSELSYFERTFRFQKFTLKFQSELLKSESSLWNSKVSFQYVFGIIMYNLLKSNEIMLESDEIISKSIGISWISCWTYVRTYENLQIPWHHVDIYEHPTCAWGHPWGTRDCGGWRVDIIVPALHLHPWNTQVLSWCTHEGTLMGPMWAPIEDCPQKIMCMNCVRCPPRGPTKTFQYTIMYPRNEPWCLQKVATHGRSIISHVLDHSSWQTQWHT